MTSKLSGIKFDWRFDMELMDLSAVKEHFILPLIYNYAEYQMRESELVRIIQSKDKEIEDYKAQGAKLSRS
jgi:hypothetical protein